MNHDKKSHGDLHFTKDLESKVKEGLKLVDNLETSSLIGVQFCFETDLMFEVASNKSNTSTNVNYHKCQKFDCQNFESSNNPSFKQCVQCGSHYCSRECQVSDWKMLHKRACAQFKEIRNGTAIDRQDIVSKVLNRIRLYICPFSVYHMQNIGSGFLFIQSPNTIQELGYLSPVSINGLAIFRSVLVHYMSLGEFIDAVMQDEFELMVVRESLEKTILNYDKSKEVVVLLKTRCGYTAILVIPLVPDFNICKVICKDYIGKDVLQLNLDD